MTKRVPYKNNILGERERRSVFDVAKRVYVRTMVRGTKSGAIMQLADFGGLG